METLTNELRFYLRPGEVPGIYATILQQKWLITNDGVTTEEWRDVPYVKPEGN